MGAIPESQVKAFIQGLVAGGAGAAGAAEAGTEDALKVAAQALAKRELSAAAQIFGEVLQDEPGHPKAVAGLARCYLESGDIERAKKTLGLVRPDGQSDEAIRAVEAEVALKERAMGAGEAAPLRAKVAANPADLQARFDLAAVLDAKGAREEAINELLEIVRRDRKWNDEAARKQLLTLFEAMGPTDARTIQGRRRLSSLLFS
jgi:putative thioredoxin